jgi:hypothetical protein
VTRRPVFPALRVLAVSGLVLGLAACSSDAEPADAAPEGWVATELGPVRVWTPEQWDEAAPAEELPDGERFALRPVGEEQFEEVLAVTVIDEPDRDATEQAHALGVRARATQGAAEWDEETVTRPGAEAAATVGFDATTLDATGTDVETRSELLVLDLPDGRQVVVSVLGEADGFTDSVLPDVLASVQVVG